MKFFEEGVLEKKSIWLYIVLWPGLCLDFIFIISKLLFDDYSLYLKAYLLETKELADVILCMPRNNDGSTYSSAFKYKIYPYYIYIVQKFQLQFEMPVVA